MTASSDDCFEQACAALDAAAPERDDWRAPLFQRLIAARRIDPARYDTELLPRLEARDSLWSGGLCWCHAGRAADSLAVAPFAPLLIEYSDLAGSASDFLSFFVGVRRAPPLLGLRIIDWQHEESSQEPQYFIAGARIAEALVANASELSRLRVFELSLPTHELRWSRERRRDVRVSIQLSPQDVSRIVAALPEGLATLRISNGLKLGALGALGGARFCSSIERLDLSGNALGAAALRRVFATPMPKLTRLDLSANPIGDGGLRSLALARGLGSLSDVIAQGCGLTEEGVAEAGARIARVVWR